MKIFAVTIYDALRMKIILHIEGNNIATIEYGLNATLGVAGCEIIKIEEYIPPEY